MGLQRVVFFEIVHRPGKTNHAADATSRHPSPSSSENHYTLGKPSEPDLAESALMCSIREDAQGLSAISWSLLAQETAKDEILGHALRLLEQNGKIDSKDPTLTIFSPISESIYIQDGVLLYNDRVIVPSSLRQGILQHLHAAHQGASTMEQRARAIVYWPGLSKDIQDTRDRCTDCNRNAPSQAATPPLPSPPPSTPFEAIFADFFDHGGCHYLVVGDRLSGWVEVLRSTAGTDLGGSAGLVHHLRRFFATFGVPEELGSDGGPEFTAGNTENFLRSWNVRHRVSSVSFPQSNGRAEVAVKAAKRLLMSNTGPTGNLDQDRFLRAILQLRNTPDRDCNLSPAQIIFGRPLRDSFTFVSRLEKFSNPNVRPLWRQAWIAKEEALRTRMSRTTESLRIHSRPLRKLTSGDRVFIQNQHGPNPTKWDRSGLVVEPLKNDQYRVKVDGSGRLTLRNRRFLRAYTPVHPTVKQQTPLPLPSLGRSQEQEQEQEHILIPTDKGTPEEVSELPQDKPCATSPHAPLPIVPTPSQSPATEGQQPDVSPPENPSTHAPPHRRPTRERRTPRRYEPETGTWVRN